MAKKGFIAEFKEFIARGNVMDLAVGVIIGGAFQSIVNSLVNDMIMPVISLLTGGVNFSNWVIRETMLRHARLQIEFKGDYIGIREMRKHVAWYTKGMQGSAKLRDEINQVESYEELENLLMEKIG